MTATEPEALPHDPSRLMDALSYEAPFLIEKLIKERIVETPGEGQALFREVLRYLILDRLYPDKKWQMYSRRIDEVWHQFILFTQPYISFCNQYFGALLHHYPSNAPGMARKTRSAPSLDAFFEFRDHYERVFGAPLPELWHDRKSVTLNRRVLLDNTVGPLALVPSGDAIMLRSERGPIFTVTGLARPALEFILRTPSFYVRELPGELSDEEKLGLIETLLALHVLLVAP